MKEFARRQTALIVAIIFIAGLPLGAATPTPTPRPTPKGRIKSTKVIAATPTPTVHYKQNSVPLQTPTPTPSKSNVIKKKTTEKNNSSQTPTPTPSKSNAIKTMPDNNQTATPLPTRPTGTGGMRIPKPVLEPAPPNPSPSVIPNTGLGSPNRLPSETKMPGPKDVSTPTEFVEKTHLMVFTKDGVATFNTGSSEFPSKLATAAKVNGPFKFQWSRDKASATELRGTLNVYGVNTNTADGPATWVTIPAGGSATNVDFTFPANSKPGHYYASIRSSLVPGTKSVANKVWLTYEGTSGGSSVNVESTNAGAPPPGPASAAYSVKLTRFVPGTADAAPKLYYKIEAPAAVSVGPISFEVYSEKFTNSQNLTSGSGEKGPIRLFTGKTGKINVSANSTKEHSAHLKKSLGSNSNEDWSIANSSTKTATFKWSGGASGSEEHPWQQPW